LTSLLGEEGKKRLVYYKRVPLFDSTFNPLSAGCGVYSLKAKPQVTEIEK